MVLAAPHTCGALPGVGWAWARLLALPAGSPCGWWAISSLLIRGTALTPAGPSDPAQVGRGGGGIFLLSCGRAAQLLPTEGGKRGLVAHLSGERPNSLLAPLGHHPGLGVWVAWPGHRLGPVEVQAPCRVPQGVGGSRGRGGRQAQQGVVGGTVALLSGGRGTRSGPVSRNQQPHVLVSPGAQNLRAESVSPPQMLEGRGPPGPPPPLSCPGCCPWLELPPGRGVQGEASGLRHPRPAGCAHVSSDGAGTRRPWSRGAQGSRPASRLPGAPQEQTAARR